jgi:methylmalonyl-CoA epimerase
MPVMATPELEHVALAVRDLDQTIAHYESIWGISASSRERVDAQGVEEAMLETGATALQLVTPTESTGSLARFLERRGEGLHHIALAVVDLQAELDRLKRAGVELIDETPRAGGRGHLVAFVHPRSNHGLLVELVQKSGA